MTPAKIVSWVIGSLVAVLLIILIVVSVIAEHNRSQQEDTDYRNAYCANFGANDPTC